MIGLFIALDAGVQPYSEPWKGSLWPVPTLTRLQEAAHGDWVQTKKDMASALRELSSLIEGPQACSPAELSIETQCEPHT